MISRPRGSLTPLGLAPQSANLEQSMRRASQLGAAGAGAGKAAPRRRQANADDGSSGTFLTSVPGMEMQRQNHLPTLDGLQVHASDDLEDRLDALSQAIGLEGTKLLKGALQAEFAHICRLAREDERESLLRAGQGMDVKELRRRLKEEEQLRGAAETSAEVLQDQLRIVGQRTQELQSKNEALENMDEQMREKIAARDADIVKLKESVHDANLRTRTEETEKLKMVDRLRRKELEMNKALESIQTLTAQLQQLGAERDSLQARILTRAL